MENNIIQEEVARSLKEDIGSGDITSELIPDNILSEAEIVTRESAIICGIPWFNEVFRQLNSDVQLNWHIKEGQQVSPNQRLVTLHGNARSLVMGERSALNWLQCLSGTATWVAYCVHQLKNTKTQLLDTRKTIPGLRYAQKYAVKIGGGHNHRIGLFDAYLIKENHIMACGSIRSAIQRARELSSNKLIEVEVENFNELEEAINAGADIVMLDNFNLKKMKKVVLMAAGRVKLEVSGNVEPKYLYRIAKTGVDYISMGALTKNIRAIDLSMRFINSLSK